MKGGLRSSWNKFTVALFLSLVFQVVHKFRNGGFNTLVSTCVGEEGLDIGEVDLIVCFDAQKNPIRLVQRMGRTGRKRQGRIVVILAVGREERVRGRSSLQMNCNLPILNTWTTIQTFFPSDLQPEPEQQTQRLQVHHQQQKWVSHVPQ